MKYISLALQNVFKFFLLFLLNYVWARYFIKKLWLSIVVSLLIAAVLSLLITLFGRKRAATSNLKIKEKEDAENMFLSLSTSKNYLDFFLKIAQKECINSVKKKNYILLDSHDKKIIFYPVLSMSELKNDEIIKIYTEKEREKADKIVITCGEISKEAFSLSQSLQCEIVLLDKFATYKQLYKYYDIFPPITTTYKKNKKMAFKELLAYSFNRSHTKGYVLAAAVLLLSTLYIRMNIYYTIMATLLLIFAIISYTNPYSNKKSKDRILD